MIDYNGNVYRSNIRFPFISDRLYGLQSFVFNKEQNDLRFILEKKILSSTLNIFKLADWISQIPDSHFAYFLQKNFSTYSFNTLVVSYSN
jgi:hypothetical protein